MMIRIFHHDRFYSRSCDYFNFIDMGAIVELILFAVVCASVGGVRGECQHVQNKEMVEYVCEGGQLSDLNDIPVATEKIRITNMPVSRITADTFSRFGSNLWVLSCSYCQIRDIEPGAFQRLRELQQLNLENNFLRTVRASWFSGLDYLTYLNLNYNEIETIEDGVYANLPSLIDLRLSGNQLECLSVEGLSKLTELKNIYIGENFQFKCPNRLSEYLERRQVIFDRDPEWENIPQDLVPLDVQDETTSLPVYRERLHPTPQTPPPPPMESTEPYIPPKFHTTEEVVYPPMYTPSWRQTPRPATEIYEDMIQSSTPSPYYEDTLRPYVPPKTIAPIDFLYETTQYNNQDATTLRSWPSSSSDRSEYPFYPAHGNEDERYGEQYYSSEATDTSPLAPSLPETSSSVESDVEHTTSYGGDWQERNTVPTDNEPSEYRSPSGPTHVIQSLPPIAPSTVQPASPDNTFQASYYEHPITVHSPPSMGNKPSQEEPTPVMIPVETTTDKPLPNCPSGSAPSNQASLATIVAALLLAAIGRILVEGF